MPWPIAPALVAAFALLAAVALTACGGEDAKLLPGETAREINANLDTVQQLSNEGDCLGAESAVEQVSEQIEALQGVDPKLKQALEEGVVRLEEVIARCEEELEAVTRPSSEEEAPPAETAKEAEKREKEAEKAEKEAEKQEKEEQKEEELEPELTPSLPPQAKGKGKGLENGHGPPVEEEGGEVPDEGTSGGVSPASPAGEG